MTAQPLDVNSVSALVADAGATPSLHDAQPWTFRFPRDSAALRLYADLERTIPPTDPDERGPRLGCGAAILNRPVAAAATAPAPVVRLLPDPDDAELTAEAGLYGSEPPDEALARLHPAISPRRSSRLPFPDEEIPVDTEGREAPDPDLLGETAQWTRTEPSGTVGAPHGIPAEAFGPRQRGTTVPVRDFTADRPMPGRGWSFEKNPHLTLLGTARDGPADWLRAGQALERVLLQATTDGLVASKTSQPLEWPEFATSSRPWPTCRWCSGSATAPKATRARGDRWPTCSTSSEAGLVA
ncbi:Acg family FMN-binding oxidoreductase [Streptomyces sp. NPDC054794]